MTRRITERTEALITEAGMPDLDQRVAKVEEQEALDRARVAQILSRRETPQS